MHKHIVLVLQYCSRCQRVHSFNKYSSTTGRTTLITGDVAPEGFAALALVTLVKLHRHLIRECGGAISNLIARPEYTLQLVSTGVTSVSDTRSGD
jgi:hypothetical protein